MDKVKLNNYKLQMVTGVMMDKKELKEGKWVKTGEKEQAYELTFVKQDLMRSKLVFLSSSVRMLELEGTTGELDVNIGFDSYGRKNFIKFSDYTPN